MENIVKEYTNGEVTIVWKPALCIHARYCWQELPEVFDPQKRPWVNVNAADTERLIEQVKRCPTDALTYYMNNEKEKNAEKSMENSCVIAEIIDNGPVVIIKSCVCVQQAGKADQKIENAVAFCRCTKSKIQPFCDGSHVDYSFE